MADYFGVLAELRDRRSALADEVAELNTVIASLDRLAGQPQMDDPGYVSSSPVRPESLLGKTLPEAVRIIMAEDRPETTRDVVDALKAGGVPSQAKSFSNQVYNTLHRGSKEDGPYVRDGNKWRLRGSRPEATTSSVGK